MFRRRRSRLAALALVAAVIATACGGPRGASVETGERTTIHMPAGLVEGAETIVLFVVMLSLPDQATWWFSAMAGLVGITVIQQVVWALRNLR